MAAATEPAVYSGTAGVLKNTTLLTSTAAEYMPTFREVIYTATPFMKALSLSAFGKKMLIEGGKVGNVTKTTGKGIKLNKGGYQHEFNLYTSTHSGGQVIAPLGNVNPEYVDPGTGGAYAWKRLVWSMMIPEEYVQDNVGNYKLLDRLKDTLKLTQMQAITDTNNILLGNASAPTSSPSGLKDLVAVTQTATIGGIASTNSYWQNVYNASSGIGGGGDLDRPLQLLRDMESTLIDIRTRSGSSNEQVLVGTRGAYQYYARAAYADGAPSGNGMLRSAEYDAADIDHLVYAQRPFIYDSAVTVPTGATASTECIYFLDFNELGASFKAREFFMLEPWEAPRAHDKQRYYQANIWVRMTPFTENRRIQGVLYNITANADAS